MRRSKPLEGFSKGLFAIALIQLSLLLTTFLCGMYGDGYGSVAVGSLFALANSLVLISMFRKIIGSGLTAVRTMKSIIVVSALGVCSIPMHFALIFQKLGIRTADGERTTDMLDAVYFSVVTWTTLGYGDVLPSREARLAVIAEVALSSIVMALLMAAIFAAIAHRRTS